jgi:aspartate-semialdehyde dehydrogenase
MKIGLIGATGLVGNVMLKVLEERNLGNYELFPAASERSIGKEIYFKNKKHSILSVEQVLDAGMDIAIFSAGAAAARHYAPLFAAKNCFVIDNSSAWRMDASVPLIVPEINAFILKKTDKIIANPNCSTIQLVMVLAPLHGSFRIRRVVVSTYQSVTGTGVKAVGQLKDERNGIEGEKAYPYPIDMNVLPHGGTFEPNGYTTEEMKLLYETRKIMGDETIQVTSTVVRVPVVGGHSEAVNIEFERAYHLEEIYNLLKSMPGVVVEDNTEQNVYPMPRFAAGKDAVFVGRIRRDFSREHSLNLWIVSDNLRKGAATNAIQIAHYLIRKMWLK